MLEENRPPFPYSAEDVATRAALGRGDAAGAAPDRLWTYFLGATIALAVLATVLPSGSYFKPSLVILLCLLVWAGFALGMTRRQRRRRLLWSLSLAGQLVTGLVTLAWTDNLFGLRLGGYAAAVDATFITASLLMIGLLFVVVRLSESAARPGNRVDTLIITIGLSSLWFEYLIWPYYDRHFFPGLLPSIGTLVGLGLIFSAVRLVLARGIPRHAKALLLLSILGALTAIGLYHWNSGHSVAGAGGLILLAWLASFACQAALALHPSGVTLLPAPETTDDSEAHPMARVAALTLAALIPVFAEMVHDWTADLRITDETVIVGAAAVLFVLVALRMKDLMVNINEHRRVLSELKTAELARAKSLEQIASSEEQFRLVVAGSFDSVLILDSRGNVSDCNPAGEAMFGFTLAEIKGRDASKILFPLSYQRPDLLSSSVGHRVELLGMRVDGSEFPIELTVSEVSRRHDLLLCVTIRDLTDRMRAEQAKRESDAKSRFLSTMSHELRTPLNSILGFAQLAEPLVASNADPRVQVYMKNILVSGWHLLTLINDVLDFSRVQSGQLKLNPTMVVLGELVESAAAKMEPIASTAGVSVSLDVDPTLILEVDPVRLEQVLLNLLTNAVKFTSTSVWLRAWRSGLGIAISVRDDGNGIAPEQHERVFEDFVQLESGSTRGFDGAGLGLPISRRLVEAMGGTVQLTSHPAGGATFTVWLPTAGSTAAEAS